MRLAPSHLRRLAAKPSNATPLFPEEGEPPASLGKVLDFLRMLWAVNHGLNKISKRMQRALGITGPQRLVIRLVGRTPGICPGDLAEQMRVHASTMTGIVERLASRGVLQRKRDPADRRRITLRLTSKGRALDQLRAGTAESLVHDALIQMSEKDRVATARVLDRLTAELRGARGKAWRAAARRSGPGGGGSSLPGA